MFRSRLVVLLPLLMGLASPALAGRLVEPRLTIAFGSHHGPRVALTLDACSGQADERILQALIANRIAATIFVTARWLHANPRALAELQAHPDLFEIENHGARHLAAVDVPATVFGVRAAGSPAAVRTEVADGAAAITAATGRRPLWFRGATAKYSASALRLIGSMGYRVAGYSLAADGGARLGAAATARRMENARDGEVILAHVNQPTRPAGQGVVAGLLALKAKGYRFVRLEDTAEPTPTVSY
ncbi:MAG: polysaccharide deacetylase family protein [Rhizobiales bacterium]|nr:polysaccharide deacetylase family protein [Hyphomicrobiales bacterium]MBI3674416.1 polysaccharide deacetylase family protein [Hyphomicrobiales bacterium]